MHIGFVYMTIIKKLTIFIWLSITFVSSSVYAQGKMPDQYRQMGGIAALAESCFNTKKLEATLFKTVGKALYNNPAIGRTLYQLMAFYFEGYESGAKKRVVWNGSLQKYNKKTFNCSSKSDASIIRKFESQILQQLGAK